jgi:rsbT antagonist protein RsbS
MPRIPVIRFGDVLVATVTEEIEDHDGLALQADIASMLEKTGAGGLLLDVSVVETLDSFLGRLLGEISRMAQLMGAQTVIVGIQPAIAVTLVELGLDFAGIRTTLDTTRGVQLLHSLIAHQRRGVGHRGRR